MTDLEHFKRMLTAARQKFDEHDWGNTIEITFDILAGGHGSKRTVGAAFFEKSIGKFLGIHHCD